MNDIFYVYELIDPFTNIPFYVGKGKGNRMYKHEILVKNKLIPNNNRHLSNKIKEIYTKDGNILYKKIIENVDENTAFLIESDQIKRIGRSDKKTGPLCNLTDGGEGTVGANHSGIKNGMFGRKHTNYTKNIISEKRKNRVWNFRHSEDHKLKLKINNPGGIKTSKPIIQLNLNGNIIKEWESCSKAAKTLFTGTKVIINSISKASQKSQSYNQFLWIFKSEYDKMINDGKELQLGEFKIRDGVKKLEQKDKIGNVIKIWNSITEACKSMNICPSTMTRISKINKLHKGYFWKIYD